MSISNSSAPKVARSETESQPMQSPFDPKITTTTAEVDAILVAQRGRVLQSANLLEQTGSPALAETFRRVVDSDFFDRKVK